MSISTRTNTVLLILTVACLSAVNSESIEAANTTCVSSYEEFQEKTFNRNNPNRYNLYQVFNPQNQHSPYAVDITFEVALANGETSRIPVEIQTNSGIWCNVTNWRWVSSPVYLIARSEYLNACAYYTLNYFRDWKTPQMTLQVPYPCPNVTMEFLTLMSSLAQEYTVDNVRERLTTPKPIMVMCGPKVRMVTTGSNTYNEVGTVSITVIFYLGAVLGIVAAMGGAVQWMKQNLQAWSDESYTYSHRHYGICWGVTGVLSLVVPVNVYMDVSILTKLNGDNGQMLPVITIILFVGVVTLPALAISLYFAWKTKPPAAPYIILQGAAILFCCCNTKRANYFVFWLALWINLIAAKLILTTHGLIILVAALVEPFAVVTNTLVLFLFFFCVVNILALLLTISAYICTKKHLRPQGQGRMMLRAAFLVPLLAAIICLCFTVSATGYLINRNPMKGSLISLLTSVAFPLLLAGTAFLLRTLMTKWLKNCDIANENIPESVKEFIPLP